ncbi:MAG TPA: hypothetical protein VGF99_15200 [Myxococcota bacterium]
MTSTTRPPKKSLPILDSLDDIRIASPCHAEWDRMTPVSASDGARARFCGDCDKNVYDLSAMTRVDAMALIERHEGRCCVRFYQRDDGTVLTEDCPVGVRALLKRAERRALGGMAAGIGMAAAFVAFLVGGANPVSRRLVEVKQTVHEQIEKIAVPEPPVTIMGAMPAPQHTMGEMAVPPAPPEREHVKMGKIAAPREMLGDIAMPDAR